MESEGGKRARLFMNGGSQAVRLPKEFRFEGAEVVVRREGKRVILEPVGPQVSRKDMAAVRRVMDELGPMTPEFEKLFQQAMRKVEES